MEATTELMTENATENVDGPPEVPSHRVLKTVVIIMGVMLVAGFIVLVAVIIGRAMTLGQNGSGVASPESAVIEIIQAPGARLVSYVVEGKAVVAHISHVGGDEIVVIDWRQGTILRRMTVTPATGAPRQD